jgi:predicted unusual protein kinase regulating ubiquinone biosynthesis (AarF/ABC1/UbiB family)
LNSSPSRRRAISAEDAEAPAVSLPLGPAEQQKKSEQAAADPSWRAGQQTLEEPPFPEPVPVELPQPDSVQLRRRIVETLRAVVRRFGPLLRTKATGGQVDKGSVAKALRLTFEDLGATYLKFGQLIASSPGMFGDDISAEFRTCLDTGPPIPFWKVRKIVESQLSSPLESIFSEFSPEPIAAASIAAVHKARLVSGREVAVKVVRPGVASLVAADIEIMEPMFSLLAKQIGLGLAGPLLQLLSGFQRQVSEELNLVNEARVMDYNRALAKALGLTKIIVPEPIHELTTRDVLTMEFVPGVAIDDLESITEFGFDPRPLVEDLVKAWFVTAARYGAFHGDVHAGNLLVIPDGRVAVLDWGIVGRIDEGTKRFLRNVVAGSLGDNSAWQEILDRLREVYGEAAREAFGQFDEDAVIDWLRSTIEPILTKPFGEVNLSVFFTDPQQRRAGALEEQARSRSLFQILRTWRRRRRLRTLAEETGIDSTEFDHGTFLLGKQLVYFERYGKMFLGDKPLLADREFFSKLVSGEPLSIPQD